MGDVILNGNKLNTFAPIQVKRQVVNGREIPEGMIQLKLGNENEEYTVFMFEEDFEQLVERQAND